MTVVGCDAVRRTAIDFMGDGAAAVEICPAVAGDGLPSDGAEAVKGKKISMICSIN